jgi:predicted phosphate transport protein (TIGR00153 family)
MPPIFGISVVMNRMSGYFSNFLTNRELFSNQFGLAANNLVDMAAMLQTVVNLEKLSGFEYLFKQIDKKESVGDDITHRIHLSLNKIVFTPLDRPDIHALASGIDDVADAIREAVGRMFLYNIDEFSAPIKQLSAIILSACVEIKNAITLLFTKKTGGLAVICCQIKNYVHEANAVYYKALATLFKDESNAIKLLKYREILFSLNSSVNKCKNVTDVFNTIMIGR